MARWTDGGREHRGDGQHDDEAVAGTGDELATRLRLAVGRLSRRVRIDGGESVPPLQLSALVTVEQHGPLRLSELARREAVTAPTMSRVLSALDEQGLVVRSADPQDARGRPHHAVPEGRAAWTRSAPSARRSSRAGSPASTTRSAAPSSPRCPHWKRCSSTTIRRTRVTDEPSPYVAVVHP